MGPILAITDNDVLKIAVALYRTAPSLATATYGPIAGWDVSAITDMSDLFAWHPDYFPGMGGPIPTPQFNADISSWDTSKVTNMARMFKSAVAFDQPLSFDTSKVTDMTSMFVEAVAFNQPLSFDTSKVTNMYAMFNNARAFDQPLSFDTSKVENMRAMFYDARAFDQPLSFDTSEEPSMENMFDNAIALSDANKHLIRCAWAGISAFEAGTSDLYANWNEASFITKDPESTKCAAGTELTEAECAAQAEYKNKVSQADLNLYPSGCWAYSGGGVPGVYFNDAPSSHQVTSSASAPICKRVCD